VTGSTSCALPVVTLAHVDMETLGDEKETKGKGGDHERAELEIGKSRDGTEEILPRLLYNLFICHITP
jgi:hypothetical protein